MANTVDPDERAHYEPSHLDLQCLQNQLLLCLALYRIIWQKQIKNDQENNMCGTCNIMLTCPCNEDPLTSHFYIVKLGCTRVYIFFLFLL